MLTALKDHTEIATKKIMTTVASAMHERDMNKGDSGDKNKSEERYLSNSYKSEDLLEEARSQKSGIDLVSSSAANSKGSSGNMQVAHIKA